MDHSEIEENLIALGEPKVLITIHYLLIVIISIFRFSINLIICSLLEMFPVTVTIISDIYLICP